MCRRATLVQSGRLGAARDRAGQIGQVASAQPISLLDKVAPDSGSYLAEGALITGRLWPFSSAQLMKRIDWPRTREPI